MPSQPNKEYGVVEMESVFYKGESKKKLIGENQNSPYWQG